MTQHFSQSKAFRDLGIFTVANYSEKRAHELFCKARWGGSKIVTCPYCATVDEHYSRRKRRQWRCKECDGIFSVTTGTPLADRKLAYKKILVLILFFVAAPRSEPVNKIHSLMKITMRTAYILYGKLREALWQQRDVTPLTGVVHIDGGHFCGKPRRANKRKRITSLAVNSRLRNRKASIAPLQKGEKLESWNVKKLKNRRVALVMRQLAEAPRMGASRTRVVIVRAEVANNVIDAIRANVSPNSTIMSDGSPAYTQLSTCLRSPHDQSQKCQGNELQAGVELSFAVFP